MEGSPNTLHAHELRRLICWEGTRKIRPVIAHPPEYNVRGRDGHRTIENQMIMCDEVSVNNDEPGREVLMSRLT